MILYGLNCVGWIDSPCVGGGLEEEGDVAGSHVERAHADDEAGQTDADGADNVPELYKMVG